MSLTLTLTALADDNRLKILELLKKGKLPPQDIQKKLEITGATLSHHLDTLKRADLISGRRDGRQIFYSLNLSVFESSAEKLIKFFQIKKSKKVQWRG